MSTSQKDGVYNAVVAHLDETDRKFEDGMEVKLSTDDRKTVIGMLVAATNAGELEVKSPKAQADLSSYWNGTLSNWLRKDTRMNGGDKYVTQNPGSRPSDPQLKATKAMLKHPDYQSKEAQEEIKKSIAEQEAALGAKKTETINMDLIPEGLRHLTLVS